jgi:hypothetical protein
MFEAITAPNRRLLTYPNLPDSFVEVRPEPMTDHRLRSSVLKARSRAIFVVGAKRFAGPHHRPDDQQPGQDPPQPLAVEAYQEKLSQPDLSRAEAPKRIDLLKHEIDLANSF